MSIENAFINFIYVTKWNLLLIAALSFSLSFKYVVNSVDPNVIASNENVETTMLPINNRLLVICSQN